MKFTVRIILFLIILISQIQPQTFTNISQQAGVNVFGANHIAVGDINNDGYQDIYVVNRAFLNLPSELEDFFFLNNGNGTFREILIESGIQKHQINWHHVGFGDFDNDGDLDLFIGLDTMYINNGSGKFTPKKVIEGLNFPSDILLGNFPLDINNDGFLDIVSSLLRRNVSDSVFFFINKDSNFFERINIQKFNVPAPGRIVWSDLNSDTKPDLVLYRYQSNIGHYLEFYVQTAPMTFILLTSAGIFPNGSIRFGDIDNDGYLDFTITQRSSLSEPSDSGQIKLYKNNGNGTFSDISILSGFYAKNKISSGGPVMGDFNHDGYLDIYISQNYYNDYLFINNRDGTFTDILANSSNMAYGGYAVILDYDRDGDLDLYVGNEMGSPFSSGENFLYRNNLSDNYNGTNNSVVLELVGVISNRNAIGARVECYSLSGSKYLRQTRYVGLQISGGQSMLPVHFGLGSSNIIDSLIVYWPSGIKQIIYNLPVHQYITITEDTTLTNVEDEIANKNYSYSLSQNYPNPFNPSTNIKFQILHRSHVTLKVFDILGREVAALVNEVKEAGDYLVTFDAYAIRGLTSGVYIYRLTAGDFSNSKKMLLLR
jgi:hypothetical protein